jgi:hypothetical protein
MVTLVTWETVITTGKLVTLVTRETVITTGKRVTLVTRETVITTAGIHEQVLKCMLFLYDFNQNLNFF